MLTDLANLLPPRVGHFLARVLGLEAVHAMFCHCDPCQEKSWPWE